MRRRWRAASTCTPTSAAVTGDAYTTTAQPASYATESSWRRRAPPLCACGWLARLWARWQDANIVLGTHIAVTGFTSRWRAQGAQFGLEDVEVVTATVDLDDVVSYRGAIASLREQASTVERWVGLRTPRDS